jgi:hypothetical protein
MGSAAASLAAAEAAAASASTTMGSSAASLAAAEASLGSGGASAGGTSAAAGAGATAAAIPMAVAAAVIVAAQLGRGGTNKDPYKAISRRRYTGVGQRGLDRDNYEGFHEREAAAARYGGGYDDYLRQQVQRVTKGYYARGSGENAEQLAVVVTAETKTFEDDMMALGFIGAKTGWNSKATLGYIEKWEAATGQDFQSRMDMMGFVGDQQGWGSQAVLNIAAEMSDMGIGWDEIERYMVSKGVTDSEVIKSIKGAYESGDSGLETPNEFMQMAQQDLTGYDSTATKQTLATFEGLDGMPDNWPDAVEAFNERGRDSDTVKTVNAKYRGQGGLDDWETLSDALDSQGKSVTANKNVRGNYSGNIPHDQMHTLLTSKAINTSTTKKIVGEMSADPTKFNRFKMDYNGPYSIGLNRDASGNSMGGMIRGMSSGGKVGGPWGDDNLYVGTVGGIHQFVESGESVINRRATSMFWPAIKAMNDIGNGRGASRHSTGGAIGGRHAGMSTDRPVNITIVVDPVTGEARIRGMAREEADKLRVNVVRANMQNSTRRVYAAR